MKTASRPVLAFQFQTAARTHHGCRRTLNEDRILARPDQGFWAIADGMGGHSGGDVAASRLIAALDDVDHSGAGFARLSDVLAQVEQVNASLFEEDQARRTVRGATLVALMAHEGHYACLWAGDSRAYRYRDDTLTPLTRDHSVVQAMIDGGLLSEADRRTHPSAHVVTRAVGTGRAIDVDTSFETIAAGDTFLLCSDGLTACVEEHELRDMMRSRTPGAVADGLLGMALDRDAHDNVSLIVIQAVTH